MKYFLPLCLLLLTFSCKKSEDDDNSIPTQTIITTDSSSNTGKLYVDILDINGNAISNAIASLFLSYDDLKNGIPLYTIKSNTNGRVDFGYVIVGNYYLTGINNLGSLRDTTVAQVLPKRTIIRKLLLH